MAPARIAVEPSHTRGVSEPDAGSQPVPSPTSPRASHLGLSALMDPYSAYKPRFHTPNSSSYDSKRDRVRSPSSCNPYSPIPILSRGSNPQNNYSATRPVESNFQAHPHRRFILPKSVASIDPLPSESLLVGHEIGDADISLIVCRGSPPQIEVNSPYSDSQQPVPRLASPNVSPIRTPNNTSSPSSYILFSESPARNHEMPLQTAVMNVRRHEQPKALQATEQENEFQPLIPLPTPVERELAELQRMYLNQQFRANQLGLVLQDTRETIQELITTAVDARYPRSDNKRDLQQTRSDQLIGPPHEVLALQQLHHQILSGMDRIGTAPENQLLREQVANLQQQIQWFESAFNKEQELRYSMTVQTQHRFPPTDADARIFELQTEVERLANENRAYAAAMNAQITSNHTDHRNEQSSRLRERALIEALEQVFGVKNIEECPSSQIMGRLIEWKKVQEKKLISTLFPALENSEARSPQLLSSPKTLEEASSIVTRHISELERALKNSSLDLSRTKKLLRRTRATSQTTISDLNKTVADTEEITASEKERLLASQTVIERLTQSRDDLAKTLDTEREQAEIFKLKIARIESKLTATEVDLESYKETLRNTRAFSADLKHELDSVQVRAGESDAIVSRITQEAQSLRTQLETCQVELKQNREVVEISKMEEARLQKIIANQSSDLSKASRELSNVLNKRPQNQDARGGKFDEASFKQLCSTLEDLEQANSKLKFEYARAQTDLENANARLDEFRSVAEMKNEEFSNEDIEELVREHVQAITNLREEADANLKEMRAECDRLVAENANLKLIVNNERNVKLREEADANMQEMRAECSRLVAEHANLNSTINKERNGKLRDDANTQEIRAECDRLVAENAALNLIIDKERNDALAFCTAQQKSAADAGEKSQALASELAQLHESLLARNNDIHRMRSAHGTIVNRLNVSISAIESERDSLLVKLEKETMEHDQERLNLNNELAECQESGISNQILLEKEMAHSKALQLQVSTLKDSLVQAQANTTEAKLTVSERDAMLKEFNDCNNELRSELEKSNNELLTVKGLLDKLNNQISDGERNLAILESLRDLEERESTLSQEFLASQLFAVHQELDNAKAFVKRIQENYDDQTTKLNGLEQHSTKIKNELDEAIDSARIAHNQVTKLEAQITDMQKKINTAQVFKSQITLQNEIIGELKSNATVLADQIEMLQRDRHHQIQLLEESQNEASVLHEELASAKKHGENLEQCIDQINSDLGRLRNRNSKLSDDATEARKEAQVARCENIELRSQMQSLVDDVDCRDKQLESLSRDLGSLKLTCEHKEAQLRSQILSLVENVDCRDKQLDSLSRDLGSLQLTCEHKENQLRSRIQSLVEDVDCRDRQLESLSRELGSLQLTCEHKENQLRSRIQSLVEDVDCRDRQLESLSRDLGSLKVTCEHNETQLRSQILSLVEDVDCRDKQLESLSRDLGSLKLTCEHNENQAITIRQERTTLRSRNADMEQHIHDLSNEMKELGDRLAHVQQSLNKYHDVHVRIQDICHVRTLSRQVLDSSALLDLVQNQFKKLEMAAEDAERILDRYMNAEKSRPTSCAPSNINENNHTRVRSSPGDRSFDQSGVQMPEKLLVSSPWPKSRSPQLESPTSPLFVETVTDKSIADDLQAKAARLQMRLSELSGQLHRVKIENKKLSDTAVQIVQLVLGDGECCDPTKSLETIHRQLKSTKCGIPLIQLPALVQNFMDEFEIQDKSDMALQDVAIKAKLAHSTIEMLCNITGESKDYLGTEMVALISLLRSEFNLTDVSSLKDIKRAFTGAVNNYKLTMKCTKEQLYAMHIPDEYIPDILRAFMMCNTRELRNTQSYRESIERKLSTHLAEYNQLQLEHQSLRDQWSRLHDKLGVEQDLGRKWESSVDQVLAHVQETKHHSLDLENQVKTLSHQVTSFDNAHKEFVGRVRSILGITSQLNANEVMETIQYNAQKMAKLRSKARMAKQQWVSLTDEIVLMIPGTKNRSEIKCQEQYNEYIITRLQHTLCDRTHLELLVTLQRLTGSPVTEVRIAFMMRNIQDRIKELEDVEKQIKSSLSSLGLSQCANSVEAVCCIVNEVHRAQNVIDLCKRAIHNTGHGDILIQNQGSVSRTLMEVLPVANTDRRRSLSQSRSASPMSRNPSTRDDPRTGSHVIIQRYDRLKEEYKQLMTFIRSMEGTTKTLEAKLVQVLSSIEAVGQSIRMPGRTTDPLVMYALDQLAEVVLRMSLADEDKCCGLMSEVVRLHTLFSQLNDLIQPGDHPFKTGGSSPLKHEYVQRGNNSRADQSFYSNNDSQESCASSKKKCERKPGVQDGATLSSLVNASLARTLKALKHVDDYND